MGRLAVVAINKVSAKATYIIGCRIAQAHPFVTVAPDFLSTTPSIGCFCSLNPLP